MTFKVRWSKQGLAAPHVQSPGGFSSSHVSHTSRQTAAAVTKHPEWSVPRPPCCPPSSGPETARHLAHPTLAVHGVVAKKNFAHKSQSASSNLWQNRNISHPELHDLRQHCITNPTVDSTPQAAKMPQEIADIKQVRSLRSVQPPCPPRGPPKLFLKKKFCFADNCTVH